MEYTWSKEVLIKVLLGLAVLCALTFIVSTFLCVVRYVCVDLPSSLFVTSLVGIFVFGIWLAILEGAND